MKAKYRSRVSVPILNMKLCVRICCPDADIAIIDPSVKKALSIDDLHVRDYSPWEGWEIDGWPTTVILRGKVMVDNGQLLGGPDDGQLIFRKVDQSILQRPAV